MGLACAAVESVTGTADDRAPVSSVSDGKADLKRFVGQDRQPALRLFVSLYCALTATHEAPRMKMSRRTFVKTSAAASLSVISASAKAATYPTRPISMIVPYGAGGPTDTIGRIIADGLREALNGTIVIENVPGASGTIGVTKFLRAANDGYTLGLGNWPTFVLNGAVFPTPYDVTKDFEPIGHIVSDPQIIISRSDLPAKNLQELIAWFKSNGDKATQGTGGPGSTSHVVGILFQRKTGINFAFVPYRQGVGAAMVDMIAGRIDTMFSVAANAIPHIKNGALKAYAVTAKKRLPAMPDVPTVDEAGLPGFYALNWHALFAPKGTPKPILETLNAALMAALANPTIRKRLEELGQEVTPKEQQTQEALTQVLKTDIATWWPVIKDAGIRNE
jgi:tripartite-type tricarboxylate transporter receptor subunit TctC